MLIFLVIAKPLKLFFIMVVIYFVTAQYKLLTDVRINILQLAAAIIRPHVSKFASIV